MRTKLRDILGRRVGFVAVVGKFGYGKRKKLLKRPFFDEEDLTVKRYRGSSRDRSQGEEAFDRQRVKNDFLPFDDGVLLLNVRFENGELAADHCWVWDHDADLIRLASATPGTVLSFTARVKNYAKSSWRAIDHEVLGRANQFSPVFDYGLEKIKDLQTITFLKADRNFRAVKARASATIGGEAA